MQKNSEDGSDLELQQLVFQHKARVEQKDYQINILKTQNESYKTDLKNLKEEMFKIDSLVKETQNENNNLEQQIYALRVQNEITNDNLKHYKFRVLELKDKLNEDESDGDNFITVIRI